VDPSLSESRPISSCVAPNDELRFLLPTQVALLGCEPVHGEKLEICLDV
jgi:hypothetical protein